MQNTETTQSKVINSIQNNLDQIELKIMQEVNKAIEEAEKETGLFFDSIEFNHIEQRVYIKLKQL